MPLRILADVNCLLDGVQMHFIGNTSLALELRIISQNILKRLEFKIAVYSNYTGLKNWEFQHDVNNSVMVWKFSNLRHIDTLSNTINCKG